MKDKLIWCDTKEKLTKVIAKLKKDGYSAESFDRMWESYGDKVTVRVRKEFKDITFASRSWYEGNNYGTPITADEFLSKSKNPAIVIFRRGREVIAKDVATGNKGIAKCSPDDEFVFNTGASIALARLMAKTPEILTDDVRAEWKKALGIEDIPARVDHKFNVGDFVTLKEGIEANKKYGGLPLLEGAMYDNAYNKRMTVVRVDWSDDSNTYYCECKGDSQFTFHYSEEMLDKWAESKICEGDKVRVKKRCTGMRYDTYYEWVKEHITDPELLLAFEREDHVDTSLDFEVVKIAPHKLFSQKPIAYIKHKGDFRTICYLFNIEALEKV